MIDRPDRDETERPLRIEDAVQYLVLRWRKLLLTFGVVAITLAAVLWAARASEVWPVRGTVSLTFHGIERHHYPTGRPFDYSELVSPGLVASARRLANLNQYPVADLTSMLSVVPETPPSVVARWQQQDRQGQARDQYFPTEFTISVGGDRLSREEKMALLKSVVTSYQTELRDQLYVTDFRVSDVLGNGEAWKTTIDPFDLPAAMRQVLPVMRAAVRSLLQAADPELGERTKPAAQRTNDAPIAPAQSELDTAFGLRFAELAAQIDQFERGPLASLEGLTYASGVTRNRELVLRTSEHRVADLSQRLEREQQEGTTLKMMLTQVDRPQFFMPNIGGQNRSVELNNDVIGTLLRNDYYADLVRKSIESGERVAAIQIERDALARRLGLLRAGGAAPTPQWDAVAQSAVEGFRTLRDRYRQLSTGYFELVAASHVRLTRGPYEDASARTPASVLAAAIIGVALLMAVLGVRLHEMVVRARKGGVKTG